MKYPIEIDRKCFNTYLLYVISGSLKLFAHLVMLKHCCNCFEVIYLILCMFNKCLVVVLLVYLFEFCYLLFVFGCSIIYRCLFKCFAHFLVMLKHVVIVLKLFILCFLCLIIVWSVLFVFV